MNQTQQKKSRSLGETCQGKGRIYIHGDALILETVQRSEVNLDGVWGWGVGVHLNEAVKELFFFSCFFFEGHKHFNQEKINLGF